jgi:hypothetical protein
MRGSPVTLAGTDLEEAARVRIHRPRLVAVPPSEHRTFLDALAELVAESVLRELRHDTMLAAEDTHQQ